MRTVAGLKRRIRRLIRRAREGLRSVWDSRRNAAARRRGADDGLPIPQGELIALVAGTDDVEWYLKCGRRAFDCFRRVLAANSVRFEDLGAVLDFGCGCGRVMRHWNAFAGVRICGTDINRDLVEWRHGNLPFTEVRAKAPMPPTGYGDGEFDLIYALSVFTHISEAAQRAWIDEFMRLLKPGGHLIITTHGEHYLGCLRGERRERFQAGEMAISEKGLAGSNSFGAYHPPAYVRTRLAPNLVLVAFEPGAVDQDVSLFRRL